MRGAFQVPMRLKVLWTCPETNVYIGSVRLQSHFFRRISNFQWLEI